MNDNNLQFPPRSTLPPEVTAVESNGTAPHPAATSPAAPPTSELMMLVRWLLGFVLIFVCGWGILGLEFYFTRRFDTSFLLTAVVSLGLFLFLEHDLWLSRFMGLYVTEHSSALLSSLSMWAFGVAGLFLRSTTHPVPAAQATSSKNLPAPEPHHTDNLREVVETVVFVVVLVLLLKSFIAEAFVIPTGSMAETLWGYQKLVECPKCHYTFPVNCSSEVDPPERERRLEITGCNCPNCRFDINFHQDNMNPRPNTGDRVLVAKFLYDTVAVPERFEVVVFKYPVDPQKNHIPMNYIKRLCGLEKETVGIYYGDLYRSTDFHYENRPPLPTEDEKRSLFAMYENDSEVVDVFQQQVDNQFEKAIGGKKFEILRKDPDKMLAVRRIVYDNDFQANDLIGKKPPRWLPESQTSPWKLDNSQQPRRFEYANGQSLSWLHYQHQLRDSDKPDLITDFMGYNTGHPHQFPQGNWVGDLMLECDVTIIQPQGELVLQLSKGADRFQARWDLTNGKCTLERLVNGKFEPLDTQPTDMKKKGTYRVRFANFDERLTVWVENALPFNAGLTYKPPKQRGPTEFDLRPASIGVNGSNVAIEHIKLWRDSYYTTARGGQPSSSDALEGYWGFDSDGWRDPSKWEPLRRLPVKTMYVQPDHYLCLGDNSPESSDGRSWGLVPRRLMLGRALMVYWPLQRAGPIR